MNPDIDLLHRIQIASPCKASWDEMRGDERVRFCQHCRLNVYNLSTMEPGDAEALVREKEGRLCVRYYARPDGTMLVEDCPVGIWAVRRMMAARFAALAAAFLALFGLRVRPTQAMGESTRSPTTKSKPFSPPALGGTTGPIRITGTAVMGFYGPVHTRSEHGATANESPAPKHSHTRRRLRHRRGR
jgi:hypothetical protein